MGVPGFSAPRSARNHPGIYGSADHRCHRQPEGAQAQGWSLGKLVMPAIKEMNACQTGIALRSALIVQLSGDGKYSGYKCTLLGGKYAITALETNCVTS